MTDSESDLPGWTNPKLILAELEVEERAEKARVHDNAQLKHRSSKEIDQQFADLLGGWEGTELPQQTTNPVASTASEGATLPAFSSTVLESIAKPFGIIRRADLDDAKPDREHAPRPLPLYKNDKMSGVVRRIRSKISAVRSVSLAERPRHGRQEVADTDFASLCPSDSPLRRAPLTADW